MTALRAAADPIAASGPTRIRTCVAQFEYYCALNSLTGTHFAETIFSCRLDGEPN
jgi:hypothetical protein